MRRFPTLMFWITLIALQGSVASFAQTPAGFPSRPVSVLTPYPAGAATDIETRLYTQKLGEIMHTTFIVDARLGAGGIVAIEGTMKAAPDGYTLMATTPSFTVLPYVNDNAHYDPVKDFAPVSMMSKTPVILCVNPALPVKTVAEYIAFAKAHPGQLNFGTSGPGGLIHLGGAWLHAATNTQATFIHYKGSGPMQTDLVENRLQVSSSSPLAMMPLIKAGKLRAIGVTTAERSKLYPDIPSIGETVPGYDYSFWVGFLAPAATPAAVVNALSAGFNQVAKAPEIAKKMAEVSAETIGSTPAQFRQMLTTEASNWRKVVQENGIKATE